MSYPNCALHSLHILYMCGGTWLGLYSYPTSLSYLITVFNFLQFQLCLIIWRETRNETKRARDVLNSGSRGCYGGYPIASSFSAVPCELKRVQNVKRMNHSTSFSFTLSLSFPLSCPLSFSFKFSILFLRKCFFGVFRLFNLFLSCFR